MPPNKSALHQGRGPCLSSFSQYSTSFAAATGFELLRLDYSPIKGPEGNIEYLLYARKNEREAEEVRNASLQAILAGVTEIVDEAHGDLDK